MSGQTKPNNERTLAIWAAMALLVLLPLGLGISEVLRVLSSPTLASMFIPRESTGTPARAPTSIPRANTRVPTRRLTSIPAGTTIPTRTRSAPVGKPRDLNGDGYPDIVGFRYRTADKECIRIFWGGPRETIGKKQTSLCSHEVEHHAVADLNRDGYLDIVLVANTGSHIFWGSDSGFSQDRQTSPPGGGQSVSIADLNGDGWLDLLVSSPRSSNAIIVFGDANAPSHFSNPQVMPLPAPYSSSIADLNRDGFLDIVFSCDGPESYVYWGNEREPYWAALHIALPANRSLENSVADLDGNGYMDIVLGSPVGPGYIYWGDKTGFDPGRRTELDTEGVSVSAIADLDNDGRLDIVLAGSSRDEPDCKAKIYWGFEGRTYSYAQSISMGSMNCGGVVAGDLDQDGYPDLVLGNGVILWGAPDGLARSGMRLPIGDEIVEGGGLSLVGSEFPAADTIYGTVERQP